jgi:P pilus assembly chaperone PapD
VLAAAGACVLSVTPAAAQLSVEVSPLRVEIQTEAGGARTQAVSLTNTGKDAVRVRATISDWRLSRDGAPQFEAPEEGRAYSASGWIRLAPPEIVLEPGAQGAVRFSLSVPPGAGAAGYRTGILFDFSPAAGDPIARAREVTFRSRIATLIYVNVGQPPAAVELTDLRIRTTPEQTQIVGTLANTSRRTVRTKGSLVITGAAGVAVREVQVPDVPVLPESEREVVVVALDKAASPLPPGEYRVELKIDVGLPTLLVGETTLKVAK